MLLAPTLVKRPAPEDEERSAKLLAAKATAVTAMKSAGYEPTPETEDALFGDGWVRVKPPEPPKPDALPLSIVPPRLSGPAFAEGGAHIHDPDASDSFTEAQDWSPIMDEPIAFLEGWLAEQPSLDAARDALPGLIATLPIGRLQTAVANAQLEAAVAGRAGLALSAEDEAESVA